VELWEDGLGYYIGTGHRYRSIAKNVIKAVFGGYHKGVLSERHRREEIVTRDRFIQKILGIRFKSLFLKKRLIGSHLSGSHWSMMGI